MYKKRGLNWTGNKYSLINNFRKFVEQKEFDKVYDLFLGSGCLLLHPNYNANYLVGNDAMDININFFNTLKYLDSKIKHEDIKNIVNNYNNFKGKEYYKLREEWNEMNKKQIFTKEYIIKTTLLLKMIMNSMIRLNSKGEINQGFRGISKSKQQKGIGFFSESSIYDITLWINNIQNKLGNAYFKNKDFYELLENDVENKSDNLLLLDVPYVWEGNNNKKQNGGIYDLSNSYTIDDEKKLLKYLDNYNGSFIYFNLLNWRDSLGNNKENKILKDFIKDKNLNIIPLRSSMGVGKNRSFNRETEEVMIVNFH